MSMMSPTPDLNGPTMPTTQMSASGDPSMPQLGVSRPTNVSIGGILSIKSADEMRAIEQAKVDQQQAQPIIQNLAAHVRHCWQAARMAKEQDTEPRMFKSMRQRRGEYDPEKLALIRQQGGSEIYMMLTSAKCRGAAAWLRDVMLSQGDQKPWTIKPMPVPSLPPDIIASLRQEAIKQVMQYTQATGAPPDDMDMRDFLMDLRESYMNQVYEEARYGVEMMELKMETQLREGGFIEAFDAFIDDLVTYPAAILKGPVVRRRSTLQWTMDAQNQAQLVVQDTLRPEYDRIDPFMAYPSPQSTGINDGYFIERHRMRQADLEALRGVDGYDDAAINSVLGEYASGGLHEWLSVDSAKAQAEGKTSATVLTNPEGLIDALQFWGDIPGKLLVEWGLTEQDIPDQAKQYPSEVWLIGRYVIKASLNYHPLGEKPYFKASYEELPGLFWGNAPPDLIRDCQDVCNSAARALVNNMGISSGPQVAVLSDRLPVGEDISQMYPWKIWQFNSDPLAQSQQKPIEFFMPDNNAQLLMQVFEKFSVLADEYSAIPRYMTGDSPAGGAGRTASGMSMLMNNANKSMQQVAANVDSMLARLLERLYFYNMKYGDDPALKRTDIRIVARGADGVIAKEQAQVRRNEFLAATANPFDMQVLGVDGRAALLREQAKGLDLDPDKIVPPRFKVTLMQKVQQRMAMLAPPGAPGAPGAQNPGTAPGAPPPPGGSQPNPTINGQQLHNGAPVTDHFSPPTS
jgi:hypothetical protein